MSDSYAHGQRDGLRLALAILAVEEQKWSLLLGESHSGRTNAARAIRRKAFHVAQQRVQTALNRMTPKDGGGIDPELVSALDKLGL